MNKELLVAAPTPILQKDAKARIKINGHRRRNIPKNVFLKIGIPVPSIEIQKKIVAEMDNIKEAGKMIDASNQKIESDLADVWGE